ncbi:MAG: hypothetical protein VW397_07570, partial [Candidatus Margulisiibacteriota bacterium]
KIIIKALALSPNIKNHSMSITFGSFDTPIGYETNFLTNNANTFANQFIINSLTYSALGGTVGTLNTLGIKIHNKYKYLDLTSSVSNGTSETAYNEKSTFERLTQLSLHSFIKGLRLTTTYFESNDQADTQDSLQTNLTVQLVEANYTLNKSFKLKLKTAKLTFDDNNSNTNDDIDTYEAEINYNKAAYLFGLRGSFWRPQGSPISSDTPNPGLATSRNTNEAVDRIQISAGYYINTNTVFKLEYFTDFYAGGFGQKSDTYQGLISGINIKF